MKKNICLLVFSFLAFAASNSLSAQSYKTGIGLRLGGLTDGLTIKQFVNNTTAFEGIVSAANSSVIVTGLYEIHVPVEQSKQLRLYYGVGGHIGFFNDGGGYYYNNNRIYTNTTVAGIDGILGMEYKFSGAPINIGFDFKPFVDFYNTSYVYFDGALSIRYTF